MGPSQRGRRLGCGLDRRQPPVDVDAAAAGLGRTVGVAVVACLDLPLPAHLGRLCPLFLARDLLSGGGDAGCVCKRYRETYYKICPRRSNVKTDTLCERAQCDKKKETYVQVNIIASSAVDVESSFKRRRHLEHVCSNLTKERLKL